VLFVGVDRGHENDRNVCRRFSFAQIGSDLIPIHIGHLYIQQHDRKVVVDGQRTEEARMDSG
jgi:hypothetical protein